MAQYFGILDGSGDVWGIRVPDLPGVYGGGATAAAALTDAASAAREWAELATAKGHALPAARAPGEIGKQVELGEVLIAVPVLVDSGRPVRANLSLDAALLDDIDHAAKIRGLTRSAFIASTMREKILTEV